MESKKQTKVLHLRSSGGFYGAEGVILGLVDALKSKGMVNRIVCINNSKNPHTELVDRALSKGLDAMSIDCKGLFDWDTVRKLRKMLKEEGFSIIHTHDYKATVFGLLASIRLKANRIATNHLWTHGNFKLRVYEFIEAILFNFFNRIIAVSGPIAVEVRPFLFNKSKLSVISNGIDCARFASQGTRQKLQRTSDSFVIGIVGRLDNQKGHRFLLQAIDKLKVKSEKSKIKVLVAGTGPLEDKLRSLSKELKIEENVEFLGFCSDIQKVFDSIDVLVIPSLSEGLPMVLLEAMWAEILVVATPVGDIPKLIKEGETGFIVQPKDVDGLVEKIKIIIKNKDKGERIKDQGLWIKDKGIRIKDQVGGNPEKISSFNLYPLSLIVENARNLVEKEYSVKSMADKYAEIYLSVMKSGVSK